MLDFGLAKVHEAQAAQATDDLTRTASDITGEGKIVGTVAYMSPEQAEGKVVDPRSDIFSLGVVLHEMATGEKPFRGDTNVSVISAIIKDTPVPITDSNPNLPADLARIVRRCLAKDPERRYQTAADLRNELEELKQDTASGIVTIARPAARGRAPRTAMIAAAGAAAVIALAVVGGWFLVSAARAANRTVGRGDIHDRSLGRLDDDRERVHGRHVARRPLRRARRRGDRRSRACGPARPRQRATCGSCRRQTSVSTAWRSRPTATTSITAPTRGGGGVASLYKVPVLGGTPALIIEDIDSPVTFSPDGQRIAFMRGSMARGTTELVVADADGSQRHASWPRHRHPTSFCPRDRRGRATGGRSWRSLRPRDPGLPGVIYACRLAKRCDPHRRRELGICP